MMLLTRNMSHFYYESFENFEFFIYLKRNRCETPMEEHFNENKEEILEMNFKFN